MVDFISLAKKTSAYKIIRSEKVENKLSHAYLIVNNDKDYAGEYLKVFAMLLACEKGYPCNSCRSCQLILEKSHPDVHFYPKEKDTVLTEDVADIIEKSNIKSLEGGKKIFIIEKGESMSGVVQNKLLKTLEEAPDNTIIIIGATNEYSLLPTLKSRVKKLTINGHKKEDLLFALKDEGDKEEIEKAIDIAGGSIGKILSLLKDENRQKIEEYVADLICNMQSSRDVLYYSKKFEGLKVSLLELVETLQIAFMDMLSVRLNAKDLIKNKGLFSRISEAKGYTEGALVYAQDRLVELQKKEKFNTNAGINLEWLLFAVLEGKYKWQK